MENAKSIWYLETEISCEIFQKGYLRKNLTLYGKTIRMFTFKKQQKNKENLQQTSRPSSDPSLQSSSWSHFQCLGIQSPFKHLNWVGRHDVVEFTKQNNYWLNSFWRTFGFKNFPSHFAMPQQMLWRLLHREASQLICSANQLTSFSMKKFS